MPTEPVGQELLNITGLYTNSLYEVNSKLEGESGIGTYNQPGMWDNMLRQNPTAHIGALSMLATIDSVDWEVRAHDKALKSVTSYTEDLFFAYLNRDFKEIAQTTAKAPFFGVAPHEKTTRLVRNRLYLADLQYRPLRSFDLWSIKLRKDGYVEGRQRYVDETGNTVSAEYGRPKKGVGWLHWPIFGDGLFGNSILRPIYNEHKEKEDIRKIRRIAVQKALFGTLLVKLRDEITPQLMAQDKATADLVNSTLEKLSQMMIHENGVASLPSFVESVDQAYANSDAIGKAIEAENHADLQILLSFAYHWIGRGLFSAYGTNASAKTDSNEQRNIRRFFLNWVSRSFNPIIKWFVDWNFGPQKYYPYLYAFYTQEQTATEITNNISKAVANKIVIPDDQLEHFIRRINGAPEHDPATARVIEDPVNKDPETPGTFDKDTGEDTRERPSEGDYT